MRILESKISFPEDLLSEFPTQYKKFKTQFREIVDMTLRARLLAVGYNLGLVLEEVDFFIKNGVLYFTLKNQRSYILNIDINSLTEWHGSKNSLKLFAGKESILLEGISLIDITMR